MTPAGWIFVLSFIVTMIYYLVALQIAGTPFF